MTQTAPEAILTDRFAEYIVASAGLFNGEPIDVAQRIIEPGTRFMSSGLDSTFERALFHYTTGMAHLQNYTIDRDAGRGAGYLLQAGQAFQKSLDADSNFAHAHYGAGLVHMFERRLRDAFSSFREALLLMGRVATHRVRFALGLSALRLDRVDIAHKCFARITSMSPEDVYGHIGTFLCFVRERDIAGAARSMRRLREILAGTPDGMPLELMQKTADMFYFQCWQQALAAEGANASSQSVMMTLASQSFIADSQQQQQQASSSSSSSSSSDAFIARVRSIVESKLDHFRQLISATRDHPNITPQLAAYADFQEGRVLAAAGRFADALPFLERATSQAAPQHDVLPAFPHLVLATLHARDKGAALKCALRAMGRLQRAGVAPYRELAEMTTTLLSLNGHPDSAVRTAKLVCDTVGISKSSSWYSSAFVNRLDHNTASAHSKQAANIQKIERSTLSNNISNNFETLDMKLQACNVATLNATSVAAAAAAALSSSAGHPSLAGADTANLSADAQATVLAAQREMTALLRQELPSLNLDALANGQLQRVGDRASFGVHARQLPLLFNIALLKEWSGEHVEAVRIYSALVRWFPSESMPFFRLGSIALERGDCETCLRWMQMCIAVCAPGERARCVTLMARALASNGLSGNASAYRLITNPVVRETVLNVAPSAEQSVLQSCAAACLTQDAQDGQHLSNKTRAALKLFEQSLRIDPRSVAAVHGVACCIGLLDSSEHASALLERITGEKCPDALVTRMAADNLFNAYVNTAAHRQALRMEEKRQVLMNQNGSGGKAGSGGGSEFFNEQQRRQITVARDRANAIICALMLVGDFQEAARRATELVAEHPKHPLTCYTAVLVCLGGILNDIATDNTPRTDEAADKVLAQLDRITQWAATAAKLRDHDSSVFFVTRLMAYIKKLQLREVTRKFVERAKADAAQQLAFQDRQIEAVTKNTADALFKRSAEEMAKEAEAQRQRELETERLLREDAERTARLRNALGARHNMMLEVLDPTNEDLVDQQMLQEQAAMLLIDPQQRLQEMQRTLDLDSQVDQDHLRSFGVAGARRSRDLENEKQQRHFSETQPKKSQPAQGIDDDPFATVLPEQDAVNGAPKQD